MIPSQSSEQYVDFVMSQATLKALSKEDIIEATRKDGLLQEVMHLISTSQWRESTQIPSGYLLKSTVS